MRHIAIAIPLIGEQSIHSKKLKAGTTLKFTAYRHTDP